MNTSEIIAELHKAAIKDRPTDAPHVAALKQALAERGDEVVKELCFLLDDLDPRVSETGADVLETLASEAAFDALVTYCLRHLDDPTGQAKPPGPGWLRLRRLGNAVLPAMARNYGPGLQVKTRLAMNFIAHQIGDPAALPLLEKALSDPDSRLGEVAAEALGSVDGAGAYDRLLQLLSSENSRHRLGAIRGLGLLKNPAAVRPLLDVLTSGDQSLLAWAPSSRDETITLHGAAAQAIDLLTGEQLDGDVESIRAWLKSHAISGG